LDKSAANLIHFMSKPVAVELPLREQLRPGLRKRQVSAGSMHGEPSTESNTQETLMTEQNDKREAAIKRLKAGRGFKIHAAIYVVVNALLVVVWASSGASYFWPIWTTLGWGIGLAFHGWSVYLQRPISEDEIRREMERDH
jgi:2TM domain